MKWFSDTNRYMKRPFAKVATGDVARSRSHLDRFDTLVLADIALPDDPRGRSVNRADYYRNLRSWVERGGNLVLTDRAVRVLEVIGGLSEGAVQDIRVYQPFTDIVDFGHMLVEGLRPNARQLVETAPLGYCIGNECSPMTVVDEAAFTGAGGHVVGTTGDGLVSLGELELGKGQVRIVGGALPLPTEENDHRYGLRNYALTYTGLFIMENAIVHDAKGLGVDGKEAGGSGGSRLLASAYGGTFAAAWWLLGLSLFGALSAGVAYMYGRKLKVRLDADRLS